MHVPELRTASRQADLAAATQWREERRMSREDGLGMPPLQMAVVTDGSDRELASRIRHSGAEVVGLLAPDTLESLVWAAEARADHGYTALDALAADAVDAACLDLPLAEASRVAGVLLAEGVSVVMARPELPDRTGIRTMLDAGSAGNATATFALQTRAWPALEAAEGLLPELGPLTQLTVLGWPAGRAARVELCDAIRRLCGEVIAVCASTSAMPVTELSPTAPVTLALLTAGGTTVVANESARGSYTEVQLTLIGSRARLVAGQRSVRIATPDGVRHVALHPGSDPVQVAAEGLRDELAGCTRSAAGIGDALAATRLLELAAASYESDAWVEA